MKLREFIEKAFERGVDLDSEMKIRLPSSMDAKELYVESIIFFESTGEQNKIILDIEDDG